MGHFDLERIYEKGFALDDDRLKNLGGVQFFFSRIRALPKGKRDEIKQDAAQTFLFAILDDRLIKDSSRTCVIVPQLLRSRSGM